jgi:predicted hydrocarbon binding protein
MSEFVRPTPELEPLFQRARARVAAKLGALQIADDSGTLHLGGERFVLIRAEALALRFADLLRSLYPALEDDEAFHSSGAVLNDLAREMGRGDAEAFGRTAGITDPLELLACGPAQLERAGWATVVIAPTSALSADEGFFLSYDYLGSFEAAAWRAGKRHAPAPACFMGAGYLAGWAGATLGLTVECREVLCLAHGDASCHFLMSPESRLDARVADYRRDHPELFPGQEPG